MIRWVVRLGVALHIVAGVMGCRPESSTSEKASGETTKVAEIIISASDCMLLDGVYLASPQEPDSTGEEILPHIEIELRGGIVSGRIGWDLAQPELWQQLKSGKYEPGTAWCVQFQAPMKLTDGGKIWTTGYLHVLRSSEDGYVAAVVWDHYDSRSDQYLLQRKAA